MRITEAVIAAFAAVSLRLQRYVKLPQWLRSSATQQGLMFVLVSLLSIVLMASASLVYVDYELGQQNKQIVKESKKLVRGKQSKVDDDPIEDDEILAVLTTAFVLSGVLVTLFTAAIVVAVTRRSQRRISRIEQVLAAAADGDLSQRTGEQNSHNDLARIAVATDEMLSRLQGSVAAMSDISANIAHELKTPITRLQHQLITLKLDAQNNCGSEQLVDDLELALIESQRLAAIFDALLRISQIESGARRSRFSEIDINKVVATVAEIYTDVAEDAGMELSVDSTATPLLLNGDRELLTQQLANLIENALRYCSAGAKINLTSGYDSSTGTVILQVADNGPGITDTEKERVFERLYRVNKSRTDGGLGIGLSLAKAVAGLHHGEITLADNHPGLRVTIMLPSTG
ncbi:sensor histidine kinase [Ferrimonas lipolytica]|uniref:histidine kinase n=1 Tax=Ferrimonas lipolytica TaxID=2724191 RepID=A0A6H1UBN9_9GAMM|nr:ATP-binding protein [Ferrimonas lipolytica]QIZ76475.1 two-component sensor histidine kinase [Ferrimonas lipolytica]